MIAVELTAEAHADLDEIDMFGVGRFGSAVSDAYMAGFHDALELLSSFPEAGQEVPGRIDGMRSLLVGRHRMYYRREGDALMIIRVLHTARDSRTLLS
ncbi:type II toxin-antitoxin system RelE/ParE family toxin [Sphingomonas gilva]|uniref:Type II toxin-antitoxin system RelE/ParE family toxin n=1 Tax=Sphingomonas gilva TaxID=2305907 RepID=A0A396RXC4_9SPHN|nr:type II toxin-antitoxin system RelE/ParE family toxin [Sphingomonas gilva]RHW19123.1 type II toxin-antitoxin system RelE/ParE family toxin [Sphingomonas gilva]